jgi:LL-diaminopimelate aminotransferase
MSATGGPSDRGSTGRGSIPAPERLTGLPGYPLAGIPEAKARLAAEGREVIDLGAGDPGLPVPQVAIEALGEASANPALQRYAFQRGLPELREAIADWMARRYGRRPHPEREVLPLIGSKEGLGHLAFAALDPGDRALIPDPGYAPYFGGPYLAGAVIERCPLLAENGFLLPPERVRQCEGDLRLVYLNYPNNPTAAVADRDYLSEMVRISRERGALLVYDNAYAEIAFDGYRPPSLLEIDGGLESGLELHSFSKSFNMTGWRLGWACGSAEWIQRLSRIKSFFDTGPYLPIQAAGAAVLADAEEFLAGNLTHLAARRDAAVEAFAAAGFSVTTPRATLYLWMPVPTRESSAEFCHRLLETEALVLLPGSALGEGGEGYVRAALTIPPERYGEASERARRIL